jgi:hypothetical protein
MTLISKWIRTGKRVAFRWHLTTRPTVNFAADTRPQCYLSEKDLLAWADYHHNAPVGVTRYTYLDVVYFDGLAPEEHAQLRAANERYKTVYDTTKGDLPALANHPPVSLNFKEGLKHVSVPVPKWGPGAIAVLSRWAQEMLNSGLYVKSKLPSASRPHIVRKTPPNAPKDIDITKCGMRACGDYRMASERLQNPFPASANSTDELIKLPGYLLLVNRPIQHVQCLRSGTRPLPPTPRNPHLARSH